MLSQSSFSSDNQVLTQSFYRALFYHFSESCDDPTQILLSKCQLAILPSDHGILTFFIVAPNQQVAEALVNQVNHIVDRASQIMIGIKQTAICFIPAEYEQEYQNLKPNLSEIPYNFLVGKVYENFSPSSEVLR